MKNLENNMIDFINNTPNAYSCADNLRKLLIDKGFIELYENDDWHNLEKNNKYFVVRGDSALIAFELPNNKEKIGFNIVAAHSDSPSFHIKPNSDIFENNYLKLNTDSYGGMINYSWLDRPLSLAGRVIIYEDGIYKTQIINIDKDLMIIPSQAIHINRDVNSKNELNLQIDMLPIISLSNKKSLIDIIMDHLDAKGITYDNICDYDLYLYNRDKGKFVGLNDEFILSPRLDDLASLFPAFTSFIEAKNNDVINVLCAFDNEEIGSLTKSGADSDFLISTLKRIADELNFNLYVALKNSFIVSADNAHAIHPNAQSKSDPTNKVFLNKGIVIKHHINYTTDSISSSIFKGICENANVPYQDFASRSDLRSGSTLGKINQSHVGVDSVDIGIPQLAMHSANETIGTKDILYMYKALLEFYNTQIIKEKNTIKLLKKNIKTEW